MKIECFVKDLLNLIDKALEDDEIDEIWDIIFKLSKMQQLQGKNKKKTMYLNYWKVTQALAEMGLEKILAFSTSEYFKEEVVHLLLHCSNNSASLRRICLKRDRVYEVLFQFFFDYQCDRELLSKSLITAYRMLLMGYIEDIEAFFMDRDIPKICDSTMESSSMMTQVLCNIEEIYDDFMQDDEAEPNCTEFMMSTVKVLLYCMKILHYVSEISDRDKKNKLKELTKAHKNVPDKLAEYLTRDNDSSRELATYPELQQLINMAKDYRRNVMTSEPNTRLIYDYASKSKSERLSLMEFKGDYFVFCSSPKCREVAYADKKLPHCARCMLARYCGRDCQKFHWENGHETYCSSYD